MPDPSAAVTGISALAIDCADPATLASWWSRLVGGPVEVDSSGDARLLPPQGPPIDFLKVPEAKSVKNRLHLDLGSRDFDLAVRQALALGATPAPDVYAGDAWQVLRDPEGNEFCILRPQS